MDESTRLVAELYDTHAASLYRYALMGEKVRVRGWPWAWACAAALVLVTVVFSVATSRLDASLVSAFEVEPDLSQSIEVLTELFGDREFASAYAPVLAAEQELLDQATQPVDPYVELGEYRR